MITKKINTMKNLKQYLIYLNQYRLLNFIIKMHRIGKIDIDKPVHAYKIRYIKIILNTEIEKIDILENAFKLKNTIYNKKEISHEFDNNQLNIQKKLLQEAKDKSSDTIVYKVKCINNNFKMITFNIISETNNDLQEL